MWSSEKELGVGEGELIREEVAGVWMEDLADRLVVFRNHHECLTAEGCPWRG